MDLTYDWMFVPFIKNVNKISDLYQLHEFHSIFTTIEVLVSLIFES